MEQTNIFDLLPTEEAERFKPKKSNDWKWSFADYPKEKNGLKVFSCFACGGGSTMGYKLAGCEVVGCCEIDPKMNEVYVKNHNPKHNFLMDIREFNNIPNEELPQELFNLDILDGSPPCTTFSMAGEREESWGKKKKFREGQAEQTLDDLSFVFIETVAKLKPKCVIMENVEGLIKGEAWSYVQKIYKQLNDIGYKVNHWLLKAQYMGVPQRRHRVFFIALRNDIDFDLQRLDMSFNYVPIMYGEVKAGVGKKMDKGSKYFKIVENAIDSDMTIADTRVRMGEKGSAFQTFYLRDNEIIATLRAKPDLIDLSTKTYISKETLRNAQTFPQDFDFINHTRTNVGYICGMSVPPVMIKRIVQRLIDQGVFKYKQIKKEESEEKEMELKMIEFQQPKDILFNYNELKTELETKCNMYETLVYTEDQIQDAKKDRSNLNKLDKALNDERIRLEREYLVPFNNFKAQIDDLRSIIKRASANCDKQIKEVEEAKKAEKKKSIKEYFDFLGFPSFVKFEMIFDEKWLNASVSTKSIQTQLGELLAKIEADLATLQNLPEFSFEAVEEYKTSLNLSKAIQEGQRLADIQKRKQAQEEEQARLKAEAEARKQAEQVAEQTGEAVFNNAPDVSSQIPQPKEEIRQWIRFQANLTTDDALALKEFFESRNIEYQPI